MKYSFKILITVFVLIFLFTDCFPQNSQTLRKGSFYSLTLDNGSVIQGKVMSLDSTVILLITKNGITEIQRQSIRNISRPKQEFINDYFSTYKKPQYRKYISLNAGIIYPESANNDYDYYSDYSSNELNSGFNLSLGYTGFFSRSIAVRTIVSYSQMKNIDVNQTNSYNNYNRTGGSLSQFVFSIDFLAGLFHPEKKINFYALAGIGFGQMNSSEVTEQYINYYTATYTYNPEGQWLFKYGFGGGVTFNLSGKIAIQAEVIYDHISPVSGFYENMNQLGIRAGIIFINF